MTMTVEVVRSNPPKMSRCRAEECGAVIEWVRTRNGRQMPITAPLVVRAEYERLDGAKVVVIDASSSHFATCPAAREFRRRQNDESRTP